MTKTPKFFRGQTVEVWRLSLEAAGWPAPAADVMARFLVGDKGPPPDWDRLMNIGRGDADARARQHAIAAYAEEAAARKARLARDIEDLQKLLRDKQQGGGAETGSGKPTTIVAYGGGRSSGSMTAVGLSIGGKLYTDADAKAELQRRRDLERDE